MGRVTLTRPLTQQPQQGFTLDLNNPITNALTFAWVASGPDINIVTGRKATPQGTVPSKAPYHNRTGRKFNATGSLDFGNSPEVNFAGVSQQTVFAGIYMPDTSTGNATGYILGHVESAWDYHMYVDSGSQQLSYAAGGDSFGNAHFPATSFGGGLKSLEGRPVALVGTYDRVNQSLYIDGVLKSSFANSNAFSSTADRFAIGARGGGGQGGATGINVDIVLIFKRVLTDAEIRSLSENPWQVFTGRPIIDVARIAALTLGAPAAVAATLTGTAQAIASGTGALSTSIRLTGTAAAVASALGTISTSVPLAGVASAISSGTGALSTSVRLAGTASATSIASGSLSGTVATLSGSAQAVASGAGALSTSIPLSGAAGATASASGTLSGSAATLTGAAQAVVSGTGSLATSIPLSGAAQVVALSSGTMPGGGATLAGVATVVATALGSITTSIPLTGTAAAQSSGSGALATAIPLAGAAAAQSSASASFAGSPAVLSGSAIVAATGQASLSTAIRLDGAASSRASSTGALMTWIALGGRAVASAAAFGGLADTSILVNPANLLRVSPENRILRVSGENRILRVPGENRILKVSA